MPTERPENTWNEFLCCLLNNFAHQNLIIDWFEDPLCSAHYLFWVCSFLGISRLERLSGIHLGWYWFLMFSMVDWKCDFTPRTSYAMASWFMSRSHITLHVKFYFRTTAKSHIVNTDKIPLNVQHIHFIDLISSNSNMILLSSSGQVLLIKKFGTG